MVNELDFEELENTLDEMSGMEGITDAIAEDVAKLDNVAKKTTPKSKPKTIKKKSVKNTTNLTKQDRIKDKPQTDISTKKTKTAPSPSLEPISKPKPAPEKNKNEGEMVMVKVNKKPTPEPEKVVYQPNPKTGKFMDIVSPLSDMSIQGIRPSKNNSLNNIKDDNISVMEMSAVEIKTPVIEEEYIETDNIMSDRQRIENSGLNSDESIGNLSDQLENIENEEEFLNDITENFDDSMDDIANEAAEDMGENLENLANILDIPDHSDSFLENVQINKRPLGSQQEAIDGMASTALADSSLITPSFSEAKANREFIEDAKSLNKLFDEEKEVIAKDIKKLNKQKNNKTANKGNNAVLYILLVVLFIILGTSLGMLAYFSGLF